MPRIAKITANATISINPRYKDDDFIAQALQTKRDRITNGIEEKIRKLLEKSIRFNSVIRALGNPQIGVYGYDLPAEFGLTDQEAKETVEYIIVVLLATVHAEIAKGRQVTKYDSSVEPSVTFLDKNDYYSDIGSLAYDSERRYKNKKRYVRRWKRRNPGKTFIEKSYNIPYGRWLVNPRDSLGTRVAGDVDSLGQYGIVYGLRPGEIPFSRSGRAIMVKFDTIGLARFGTRAQFPYELPAVLKPVAGAKNFIDLVAKSPNFLNAATKIVISEVNKEL